MKYNVNPSHYKYTDDDYAAVNSPFHLWICLFHYNDHTNYRCVKGAYWHSLIPDTPKCRTSCTNWMQFHIQQGT